MTKKQTTRILRNDRHITQTGRAAKNQVRFQAPPFNIQGDAAIAGRRRPGGLDYPEK